MEHDHIDAERLSAFLEGELDSPDKDRISQHLEVCPDCREVLVQLKAMTEAATGLEQLLPAESTWRAIATRTVERRPALRRWVWAAVPVAAAAALMVVVLTPPEPKPGTPAVAEAVRPLRPDGEVAAGLVSEYESYVRGIDEAIEECEAALAQNPNNPRVRMAYLNARASRVHALDNLASYGGD